MLKLSDILVAHKEIDSFEELVPVIQAVARGGERFRLRRFRRWAFDPSANRPGPAKASNRSTKRGERRFHAG